MKKYSILVVFFIFSICFQGTASFAGPNEETQTPIFSSGHYNYTSQVIDLSFSLSGGYRVDQIDWNIAGSLGNDSWNILSELIWENLKIYQIKFDNKTIIKDKFYFRGALSKGWIYSGSNQDTDYNGNNRANAWSQSKNAADEGHLFDLSLGVGYIFKPLNSRFQLTPLVGFSHHNQSLNITDGYQTISEPILDKQIFPIPEGPFPALNSTYKTNWIGPWSGLEMAYNWKKAGRLAITIEYHWADYYANADWNLIERFDHPKSFEHNASGNGIVFNINWYSRFYKNWYYNLNLDHQSWQTDPGVDRTFFSDGTVAETRLNEVNWESFAVMCGVAYHF